MKVLKPRAALLSDFEVLRVLKQLEQEQQDRTAKAHEPASEDGATRDQLQTQGEDDDVWLTKIPENLRTVQYETISALSQITRPCAHQTEHGIAAFLEALQQRGYSVTDAESRRGALGLNKSERLQIVNNAPQSIVELHTLVEELQERFHPHQIDEIVCLVQTHLPINSDGLGNEYAEQGAQTLAYEESGGPTDEGVSAAAVKPAQRSEFTGQTAAAAELGVSQEGGLAHVPGPDPEHQVADIEYEEDAMDDDDVFVNEGFGEVGVEHEDPDD
ncbi:hypothetical protein BCV70DRAFT_199948 [Testicularia cyperi]|uniref:DNA-directed RNA polymerase III subunit RPC9 n=1 Tax=Testicularia cyperi TaxID=1882483 RepID=A0A317XS26_9BASI|nr:hypothetical protein BCV70DRAFT_199948 [Testicularia cyperi]